MKKIVNIYNKGGLSVDMEFKIYNSPCANNGKNHKYKYKISGDLLSSTRFLVWSLDINDCNGGTKTITRSVEVGPNQKVGIYLESMNYQFNSKLFDPNDIYDVRISSNFIRSEKRVEVKKNTIPEDIFGKDNTGTKLTKLNNKVDYGEEIVLYPSKGELAPGAKWVWYTDKCKGTKLGEGSELRINIIEDITVYLGIQGGTNNVACISKKVYANVDSKLPSKIVSPALICKGQSVSLNIADGYLGPNSKWEWFENECDGKKIGEGITISVTPISDTKYYVRASGVNPTEFCLVRFVKVAENLESKLPIDLMVPKDVCHGNSVVLEAVGGELAVGSEWTWYFTQDGSSMQKVGAGERKSVYPKNSGFYSLTTEGICGPSEKYVVSNKVKVHKPNSSMYLSYSPFVPNIGDKVSIKVANASKNSKWTWLINSKELKTKNSEIKYKLKESASVSVSEEGYCSSQKMTKYISAKKKAPSSTPSPKYKELTTWYSKNTYNNKTFHFGASIGLFNNLKLYTLDIDQLLSSNLLRVPQISGVEYQLSFHPIIRNKISYGIYFQHQIGINSFSFLNKSDDETYSDLSLNKYIIGNTLCFGANGFKFLVGFERKYEDFSFFYTNPNLNVYSSQMYVQNIEDEFKFGFRFLPYTNKKHKRGVTLDAMFILFQENNIYNNDGSQGNNNFSEIFTTFNYQASRLRYGGELNLWMQSGIGFNFSYIQTNPFPSAYKNRSYYQMSVLWNFDFFR